MINVTKTPPRILIVDDDPDLLDSLHDIVRLEDDYTVKTAMDVISAKKTANTFSPDIALLDIKLKHGSGLELINVLKYNDSDTVCIMMTAYRDVQYAIEAIRLGADDYLHKPLEPIKLIGTLKQYIERQRLRREKSEIERRFNAVFEQTFGFLFLLDPEGMLLEANRTALAFLGVDKQAVVNRKFWRTIWWQSSSASQEQLQAAIAEAAEGQFVRFEIEIPDNGKAVSFDFSLKPVLNETGQVILIISEGWDISERKLAEAKIERMAYYDELTCLPNRRLLMDRLRSALTTAVRHNIHGALLFLDLDHFKNINDALGHTSGDALLQKVAQRLIGQVRSEDTIARLGGDEFVVLLPHLSIKFENSARQTQVVAEKIRSHLAKPFILHGQEHYVTSSIGVVIFPDAADTVEELLKYADTAMYESKAGGRNTIRYYQPHMKTAVNERLSLDKDLHLALERSEFLLYYQPQVDIRKRIIGIEALLRWQHPGRGLLSPSRFMQVAEESGLILPIGDWVLFNACRHFKQWMNIGIGAHLQCLSINISARQFYQLGFVERITGVLEKTAFPAACLKLELNEAAIMADIEEAIEKMRALHSLGVRFSIDNFGTGYSSLSYLKHLPLDNLKIDRSFVRNIADDPHNAAIAETIISMARHLQFKVTAEGVETEEEYRFLQKKGCWYYQGFYFHRPLPLHEVTELLRKAAP